MLPHSLRSFLDNHHGIELINYHWVDLAGFLMARAVPINRCIELAERSLPLALGNHCLIGLANSSHLTTASASSGWDSLYPDWSTLRVLDSQNASVMCNVSEELATHPDLDPSNFYLRCPRSTLQKVVEYGKTEHQLFFLTGFEIEFYLLDPETIADRSKFNSPPYLFRNGACGLSNKYGRCAQDCVGRMQKSGIVVETLHTIGGRQQYQISTGPLPVLQSTDALVQAQEIIRLTALDHILRAVFLPKPFENSDSSAIHAHLSINTLKDHKLVLQQEKEFIEDSFMTGVLDRLPLITAIGMPTEVSYRRVNPLAVGKWVAWGTGNRDTPVRRIKHNRWEFRAMDVTANMYLTMATYIASGLLGIQNKRGLQIQDTTEPIEALSEDILRNRGITTPMPPSLKEAMVALKLPKYQEYLDTILGPQILNFYIKVKEQEIACLASYTDEERESLYFEFY